jgi:hypothetical protein
MHCDPENRWWAAPTPSTPTFRRLLELAAAHGFALMPAMYELSLESGARVGRGEVVPDKQLGPFFVVNIGPDDIDDSGGGDDTWEIVIRSGSRLLTEGRVRGNLALSTVGLYTGDGQELPAPIVVQRGDALQVEVTVVTGTTLNASQAMFAYGYHCRHLDGRMPGEDADALARAVLAEGEFVMGGVVLDDADNDGFAAQADTEWTHFGLEVSSAGTLTSYTARVGNVDLFPKRLTVVKQLREIGHPAYFQCRLPQLQGERVDASQNGAGGFQSRLVLLGRRFKR